MSAARPYTQPVNLTVIVEKFPPPEISAGISALSLAVYIHKSILCAARFLSEKFHFQIMQDKWGDYWVQKAFDIIVPIGGRRVFSIITDISHSIDWLDRIHMKVKGLCRSRISGDVPYATGVVALYEKLAPVDVLMSMIPSYLGAPDTRHLMELTPVTVWTLFRDWFSNELKKTYTLPRVELYKLARSCWTYCSSDDMWSDITLNYNEARDNLRLECLTARQFVNRELEDREHPQNPAHMLRHIGLELDTLPKKPAFSGAGPPKQFSQFES